MHQVPRLRRELVIAALFVLAAALAATIAFASGGQRAFRAHTHLSAAGCTAGLVAV